MSEGRLIVVEDDLAMQRLLKTQLTARGFDVHVVDNGPDALTAVADMSPDLVLLDIGLPGMDGLEVCRNLREWSSGPIILVSAQDAPQTKEQALEMGADDYLTKPFHIGELVARIRAVLRRAGKLTTQVQTVVEIGPLRIDTVKRQVIRDGVEVRVTKTEFDLLKEFVNNADRVLTYDQLLRAIWGPGYDDPRLVHVHVCNLRRKIETGPGGMRYIIATAGVGYMLRSSGG